MSDGSAPGGPARRAGFFFVQLNWKRWPGSANRAITVRYFGAVRHDLEGTRKHPTTLTNRPPRKSENNRTETDHPGT